MEELESLLLEAAGRNSSASKRQPKGSYFDNGSDTNDDSSSEEQRYATRKPSASKAPLKRLDSGENDEDEDDNVDSESNGSVGSDLYKDEYDRKRLAQMTELQREMILSERAQIRDEQRLTERVRAKQKRAVNKERSETPTSDVRLSAANKELPDTPTSRVRWSARCAEKSAGKDEILNELQAKRLKHSVSLMGPKGSDSSQSEDQNQTQSYEREEESVGEENDESLKDEEPQTLDDISEITIKRSKLAKWITAPFFEELIVGCFVRVGIGMKDNLPFYRLCVVKNVDSTEFNTQYKLDNKSTKKYLNVTWGKSEHKWEISVISDSLPLEREFLEWVQAMKHDGLQMPTRKEILEKAAAIQNPSATVKKFITSPRPLNIATEKARLRREMEVAESRENMAEVERIKARLTELDAARKTEEKDSKAVKLSEMNKKNRVENFKNASELKQVNTSLKAGQEGYDPFSRRWTRSRNYYVSNPREGNEAEEEVIDDKVEQGGGKEVVVVAAKVAGKLVDTKAPVDQELNRKHDFELPISLAELQRYGGPNGALLGYMTRKRKIEAKIGCRVPVNDGISHLRILSVSDYKRRRNLI